MTASLERFVRAQAGGVHAAALDELRRGRKTGHWMWFVFPQVIGLGRSSTAQLYAIESLEEARAYLRHPLLGLRLRQACEALLSTPNGLTADEILGGVDAMKLRSSMTLFLRAEPGDALFARVLDRFFGGRPDELTERILGGEP